MRTYADRAVAIFLLLGLWHFLSQWYCTDAVTSWYERAAISFAD